MIDLSIAAADRLRAQIGSQLTLVGTLADFAALADLPRSTPAAYVLPVGERAEASPTYGRHTQRHECTFDVLLIVRHAGDASGGKSAAALQTLRLAVQAALVNWTPDADCGAVRFVAGDIADYIDGTTIWRDGFSVERWVQRG